MGSRRTGLNCTILKGHIRAFQQLEAVCFCSSGPNSGVNNGVSKSVQIDGNVSAIPLYLYTAALSCLQKLNGVIILRCFHCLSQSQVVCVTDLCHGNLLQGHNGISVPVFYADIARSAEVIGRIFRIAVGGVVILEGTAINKESRSRAINFV